MAEQGWIATREHRCHPPSSPGQLRAPDGIDATPDTVQPATGVSTIDLVGRHACLEQLPTAHHAVLFGGQVPQR
jgi:hypothetical protein